MLNRVMKNVLLLLLVMSAINLFGIDMPTDSIILTKIFGKTDNGGKTYSYKYIGEEGEYVYQDSVTFCVVYKTTININNSNVILAIVRAPYGNLHGHQLGYEYLYFLKSVGNTIMLVDSITSDNLEPLGDTRMYEIVDIGKNKKALIFTFESSGNHHYENTKNICLLELGAITPLFSICTVYDNSCCISIESENDSCSAEHLEAVYEIEKTDTEWYNIKVHYTQYEFTKGCTANFVKSETNKIFMYLNGKYIEAENK